MYCAYTTLSYTALTFVIQPKDVLTNLGESIEFSIKTSPMATTYLWHFQEKQITSEDIDYEGYKTDNLLIPKCLPKHRGAYKCIVTDEAGETLSSESGMLKFGELSFCDSKYFWMIQCID